MDDGVMAIRADGLRKSFGALDAVADLGFAIPPGAVVGLLGPNGAGKTTTLKLLLGLLLYFVWNPTVASALADFGAAMKNAPLRYFAVEHAATMLLAIVIAHVGRARSRRKEGRARYRSVLITTALWLLLTLAAIPWPGLDIARPLFRM